MAKLRGLEERKNGRGVEPKDREARGARQRNEGNAPTPREDALDALITAGAGALVGKLVGLVPPRRTPGMVGLLRGGAAGAGAALLRELVDPLLHGEKRKVPCSHGGGWPSGNRTISCGAISSGPTSG